MSKPPPYGLSATLRKLITLVGTGGLAAARSRSRSDNALRCHSLRSRRFATPTVRNIVRFTDIAGGRYAASGKNPPLRVKCPIVGAIHESPALLRAVMGASPYRQRYSMVGGGAFDAPKYQLFYRYRGRSQNALAEDGGSKPPPYGLSATLRKPITLAFSCGRRGTAAGFPEANEMSFGGSRRAVDEESLSCGCWFFL